MSEMLVVVQSSGLRSKPATKESILEMYRRGKLKDDWTVVAVGGSYSASVGEFVGESEFDESLSIRKDQRAASDAGKKSKASVKSQRSTPTKSQRSTPTKSASLDSPPPLPDGLPEHGRSESTRLHRDSPIQPASGLRLRLRTFIALLLLSALFGNCLPRLPFWESVMNRFRGFAKLEPQGNREKAAGDPDQNRKLPPAPRLNAASDLERVRAFLRETTHTGKWEEVRYWEPMKFADENDWDALDQIRHRLMTRIPNAIWGDVVLSMQDLRQRYNGDPTSRFFHMKYRSPNEHGAVELFDCVYLVTDDGVADISSSYPGKMIAAGWDMLATHRKVTDEEKRNARDPLGGEGTPLHDMFDQALRNR